MESIKLWTPAAAIGPLNPLLWMKVARNVNVSRMVISRLWKQFQTMGTVVSKSGQVRRKATPTEDLYLTNARRCRHMTAKELSEDITAATNC
ncbi:hypothetical protein TNCV_5000661 [Trichonephila clavipes]|nr:hypothetical protein TNCV_5000661 [Trichonephila clavipes]